MSIHLLAEITEKSVIFVCLEDCQGIILVKFSVQVDTPSVLKVHQRVHL